MVSQLLLAVKLTDMPLREYFCLSYMWAWSKAYPMSYFCLSYVVVIEGIILCLYIARPTQHFTLRKSSGILNVIDLCDKTRYSWSLFRGYSESVLRQIYQNNATLFSIDFGLRSYCSPPRAWPCLGGGGVPSESMAMPGGGGGGVRLEILESGEHIPDTIQSTRRGRRNGSGKVYH